MVVQENRYSKWKGKQVTEVNEDNISLWILGYNRPEQLIILNSGKNNLLF